MGDRRNGKTADLKARDGVPVRGASVMRTPLRDAEEARLLGMWLDKTNDRLDKAEGCGLGETQHAIAEVLGEAVGGYVMDPCVVYNWVRLVELDACLFGRSVEAAKWGEKDFASLYFKMWHELSSFLRARLGGKAREYHEQMTYRDEDLRTLREALVQ